MNRLLRAMIPAAMRELLRDYRALPSWAARRQLIALRTRRWRGRRRDLLPASLERPHAVLFVCHGNIMRSPVAEVLLREAAARAGSDTIVVASAGLRARRGRSADPRALAAARRFGVSLDQHRAQPLDRTLVDWAHTIFVMDWRNEAELLARFPDAAAKVLLLGAFGPQDVPGAPTIPDPYTGGTAAADACYRQLGAAVERVAERLLGDRAVASHVTGNAF